LDLDNNAADSGYQVAGTLHDIFIFRDGNAVVRIGTGLAWPTLTARSDASETSLVRLTTQAGIWVNKYQMDFCRFDDGANDFKVVEANMGVYLGTVYITTDGRTLMTFNPAPAAGGNTSNLTLYNAYNKVPTMAVSRSTDVAQVGTGAWRQTNGDAGNIISWVDGLADVSVEATTRNFVLSAAATSNEIGLAFDWAAGAPADIGAGPLALSGSVTVVTSTPPLLGRHNVVSLENAAAGAGNGIGNGSGYQALTWWGWL
jgi:hypothetical protein